MRDGAEIYRIALTETNSAWLFIEVMVLRACEEVDGAPTTLNAW